MTAFDFRQLDIAQIRLLLELVRTGRFEATLIIRRVPLDVIPTPLRIANDCRRKGH